MQDSLSKIPNIFRSSGVARYVHMQDIGLEHAGQNKSEGRMDSETACVAHEVFEQGKFLGGKVNGASSTRPRPVSTRIGRSAFRPLTSLRIATPSSRGRCKSS